MNVYAKQKQKYDKCRKTLGYQRREGGYKLGVRNQQIQTTMNKVDKQQGYIVQHWELQPLCCNSF